jgi:uncharacterized protein YutE (UPF0331/DUF86 family)
LAVNNRVVRQRLDLIWSSLSRLKAFILMSKAEFLSHPDNFAIAEHHLRRALEAVFDVGRHIIAKEGFGHPPDYRAIILTLGQHKVIEQNFAHSILGMAGYRNRLVHGYAEITPEEMHEIITNRLTDFETFIRQVLRYLEWYGGK